MLSHNYLKPKHSKFRLKPVGSTAAGLGENASRKRIQNTLRRNFARSFTHGTTSSNLIGSKQGG